MFEVGKKYTATFAKDKVFECLKVGKKTALVQNVEWEQDVMVPPLEQLTRGVWKEYKEPRTITRWVNVYDQGSELAFGNVWSDEAAAIRHGRTAEGGESKYLTTLPISYTEPH